MIYLTETGAYFEEDYKALEASQCMAHVGAFYLHLKVQKDMSFSEAHVLEFREHEKAVYRQEQYDIWN